MRRRIVRGDFGPGERLPTFQEIETSFAVSRGVAQIAVQRLRRAGFIDAASRQGLCVPLAPPHLSRYGIVFPVSHADPAWSVFDAVLVREAHALQQARPGREFPVFAGVGDSREGGQVLGQLRREVLEDRLAGLILTPGCQELADREPYNDPALPKVFLFRNPGDGHGCIVSGDGDAIIDRSLQHLADQGCRRVAVIRVQGAYSGIGPVHFERHGLAFRPSWVQVVARGDTVVLGTLIPLLMDSPAPRRPDGLFIMDDSLVDHAASALVGAGLRIGHDIHVVAHANWPSRAPSAVPVRRIGFHVGHMLARCVEDIDGRRQGRAVPDVQRVPALFEDEVH